MYFAAECEGNSATRPEVLVELSMAAWDVSPPYGRLNFVFIGHALYFTQRPAVRRVVLANSLPLLGGILPLDGLFWKNLRAARLAQGSGSGAMAPAALAAAASSVMDTRRGDALYDNEGALEPMSSAAGLWLAHQRGAWAQRGRRQRRAGRAGHAAVRASSAHQRAEVLKWAWAWGGCMRVL